MHTSPALSFPPSHLQIGCPLFAQFPQLCSNESKSLHPSPPHLPPIIFGWLNLPYDGKATKNWELDYNFKVGHLLPLFSSLGLPTERERSQGRSHTKWPSLSLTRGKHVSGDEMRRKVGPIIGKVKFIHKPFLTKFRWSHSVEWMEWMSHRKQKETKQQPVTAGPGNILGCCLVYLSFLCDIHSIHSVFNISETV